MMKKFLLLGLILVAFVLPGFAGIAMADNPAQAYGAGGAWHEWAQTTKPASYYERFEAGFDVHDGVAVSGCIHWTFYWNGQNIGGGDSWFYTTFVSQQITHQYYPNDWCESWVSVTNLPVRVPYVNYLPQIHSWQLYP
jgi:hypothetical protein